MQQFEFYGEKPAGWTMNGIVNRMNELGKEGWQLAAVYQGGYCIFQRRMNQGAPQPPQTPQSVGPVVFGLEHQNDDPRNPYLVREGIRREQQLSTRPVED